MHGLINRAIERFTRDNYGDAFWVSVTRKAGLDFTSFEAMLVYDTQITLNVLGKLAEGLNRHRAELLEDLGTYLVVSPKTVGLRRLLRFGGPDFLEFLYSLDDLPARTLLALPQLVLPRLEIREHTPSLFSLSFSSDPETGWIFGHVMLGLLRAMADDYGALVYIDYSPGSQGQEVIEVTLLETSFAQAKAFDLGKTTG